ncbi:MAG: multidrug effflux MFS transporter [Desulfovibrionaceae bacterium]|nr:multidrug effflux MFS transporter [Desulfovibrionaceae bacterium]
MSSPTLLQEQSGLRFAYTTVLISLLCAFGPVCTDMYLPTLPEIAEDLGISAALTQGTITANLLGLALGQLIIGPISDGRGRHGVLIVSLALFTVTSALCAVSTSGPMLLAMRFLQGLGGAGGVVLSRAICCDIYQGSRLTQYLAMLMAINSVAPILGPVAGGFMGARFGWQSIFYALTVFGALLFIACKFTLPESLAPEKRVQGGIGASLLNMRRLFTEPAFLCYLGVQGFTMGGFFGYIAASPFIIQNIYGLSMEVYSVLFAVNSMGLMLVSLLAGKLSARMGDTRLLLCGDVLRTAACVLVCVVTFERPDSWIVVAVSLSAMVMLQGLTLSASFSLAIASQTVGAGAASGLVGVATFLFGAIASPVVGLAGPMSMTPFGLTALVTGLGSITCTILGNRLHSGKPHRLVH